jgi:hypothetical protein
MKSRTMSSAITRRARFARGAALAAAVASLVVIAGSCHQNVHFQGLKINELRYVRLAEPGDVACGAFVELAGPPGMSVGGLILRIFQGSSVVRSHTLPATLVIPEDGHLLISNTATVKASDRTTSVPVDYQVADYPGWDWLPAAPDSGVSIVLDDPVVAGDDPEVVDSVRYNPSGSPVPSWWQVPAPATDGAGEESPAPGLPRFSTQDPAWGISRVGEVDLDANAADLLVASVTPGAKNEELWYDETTPLPALFRPRLSEVMPNTNGYKDENSFVEIWGVAGQRWDAGPGIYELIALNGASAPGSQRNWLALAGEIPSGGNFVVADSPRLPAQYGGITPHQQVRCTDLHLPASACTGASASEWDWLGNYQDAGIKLEYWISSTRRILVDSLRWSPANAAEAENLFRFGEGLAPLEASSPATSFSRFGADTHVNRNDFQHSDPTPGADNIAPAVTGSLVSRYAATFTPIGVVPPNANGKVVLFDQTKHQKAGATGHWIVTENGDYTDWAWQLHELGYQIKAAGTGNTGAAEALTAADLAGVHVLVIPEPQAAYSAAERAAILAYLQGGGSLFFIANHKGSDRDSDGWDSWRIWMESLDLDAVTGVELIEANTIGENLITHATTAAAGHAILTDTMTAACTSGSPGCTLTDAILFRPPGIGIFSGTFMRAAASLPAGITSITALVEGDRPAVSRDPHRLDAYGGAAPTETFAVAAQTGWGPGAMARIVVLGDSAVLNDGGSSDYATYAASLAYNAYGTSARNSLLGVNVIHWLAGGSPTAASSLAPSLKPAP